MRQTDPLNIPFCRQQRLLFPKFSHPPVAEFRSLLPPLSFLSNWPKTLILSSLEYQPLGLILTYRIFISYQLSFFDTHHLFDAFCFRPTFLISSFSISPCLCNQLWNRYSSKSNQILLLSFATPITHLCHSPPLRPWTFWNQDEFLDLLVHLGVGLFSFSSKAFLSQLSVLQMHSWWPLFGHSESSTFTHSIF